MKDLKYLIAYLAPLSAMAAVYFGGYLSFAAFLVAFVSIPILELVLPKSTKNFTPEEEEVRLTTRLFDYLIYFNIPLIFILLWMYFTRVSAGGLELYELIGMTISVGINGAACINVAHELGHRDEKYEQFMSKLLLMTTLYMHFFIEHNRGHHKNVATDEDPASSRTGEILYTFWIRSVSGGYMSAWNLENTRLERAGEKVWSLKNEMIIYHIIQVAYLVIVGLIFGWAVVPFAIAVGVIGFLLLETVNYIEHYGLRRKKLPSGRYEKVGPHHSWNSDHELGRIFLYELTRHSDHHYKANRKYQVLRHFEESPQLPLGYPGSMLMSFIPPLWFWYMDGKVEDYNRQFQLSM